MPDAILQNIVHTHTQTHTDIGVGAVQLGEAGGLQEPFPLGCRMRSRGLQFGRRSAVGQRQSAGRPPAHVRTKLICTEPHRKLLFRRRRQTHWRWISIPLMIPCILNLFVFKIWLVCSVTTKRWTTGYFLNKVMYECEVRWKDAMNPGTEDQGLRLTPREKREGRVS